jgi:hypothetical protein
MQQATAHRTELEQPAVPDEVRQRKRKSGFNQQPEYVSERTQSRLHMQRVGLSEPRQGTNNDRFPGLTTQAGRMAISWHRDCKHLPHSIRRCRMQAITCFQSGANLHTITVEARKKFRDVNKAPIKDILPSRSCP